MRSMEVILEELAKGMISIAAHLVDSFLKMEKEQVDKINDMYIAALGEQI